MRRRMPWLALPFLLATCLLPRAATAQGRCDPIFDDLDLILEGQIGEKDVRARIGRGGADDPDDELAVSGEFEYGTRWKTALFEFEVDGVVRQDCSFQLNELDSMRRTTGAWVLVFTGGRFEGIRTDAASGLTSPIVLRHAPDVDCSGREAWREFRSARWPVTFSYPTNWQLTEDEDGIELLCPDPERLVFDGRPIWLERGVGFEPTVTEAGRKGTTAGRFFVRYPPAPWLVGDYDCGEGRAWMLKCQPARTGRRFGMMVLQGSGGEDRQYSRRGYVGQGGGSIVYLFARGNRWVTLHSHDTPDWLDDQPGPARFDGDGVTERIVRSIRPVPR